MRAATFSRWGIAALVVVLGAAPATAQSGEVRALNAVLRHRAYRLGDSTRFDACSVYTALGRPAGFPAGVDPALTRLLDRTSDPCRRDSTSVAVHWPPYLVRVDSLAPARAVLTVVKGEYSFREAYSLRSGDVREVRTYGFTQALLVPPGRRRLPPNPSP